MAERATSSLKSTLIAACWGKRRIRLPLASSLAESGQSIKPKRGPPLALSSDAVSGRPGGSEAVSAQTRLRSPAQKPLGTNERTTFLYISSRLDQRLFEATVERR